MQAGREGDPVEAREDAEGGDGGVDVEAGGETGGDDERGDGGGREVHGCLRSVGAAGLCLGDGIADGCRGAIG